MDDRLECRICITYGHRTDLKTEVGMYCPNTGRYEPLGAYGPDQREVDRFVLGLKERIEREGHWCTFSSRQGPR